ncbi:HlyD family efflux transporter periplasmic adaptor subunit [Alicyclobacillus macrosporangiidus]|uniref:Barrel-sandwich domain of CusB or HlyD membrane-fusion n=1 Tax=Alicyclobacillus macrosporangiidus TaxID=392015 RepID=A0A1I7JGK5_9BACL|nr:efflux RND transporter periplasmic adaptor subunit [Alicyclobacillus macrosporangiidus]SFU84294.1 Barrel-sandwich domain of CusB or HlyD membrane-fusion [Alicyclobacillus macrosporangiidus]
MSPKGRKIILSILAVVIVVGGSIGAWLYRQSQLYLSTDDAYVDGQQIVVAAPASGQLQGWTGQVGNTFQQGSTVGQVVTRTGDASSSVPVPIPANATIVQNDAVNGEFVAVGTPLAYAYNMNDLWVTANIKEKLVHTVAVGDPVDITVDAYPHLVLHGKVVRIGLATANTFALLPTESTNANFTKVQQVVPVKIALYGYQGLGLVPGLSVEVRIHKHA